MLLFTILSRSLALGFSIVIIAWAGSETTKTARRARVLAGCYFIFIEGSWLALYGLGMAGYLPARLYDGLHLTRMLAVNAVVVMYLGMFLDASVGTRVADGNHEALDPHLIKRFGITKREGEIIQQLCLGKSNEEIGEILFISTRTVKGHLYRIFRKTNVKNRVQLANLFGERVRKIGESEER
jgi:DNA-binding CsgD family transcriptional regulator